MKSKNDANAAVKCYAEALGRGLNYTHAAVLCSNNQSAPLLMDYFNSKRWRF